MSLADVTALIRAILVPILVVTGTVLAGLLLYILIGRGARTMSERRRERLAARYRPLIDALLDPARATESMRRLASAPARHRPVLTDLLLATVRIASGAFVDQIREAAAHLGLIDAWTVALADRRWWKRAEAARALGCVREHAAGPALVARLADDHEEVRAAAVESLGLLGDPRAIEALVAGLARDSGQQRARVVLALRALGPSVVEPLLAHERRHPRDTATVAELLGLVRGVTAVDTLTSWCADARPEVRAAALGALGTLGPCASTYYYALRALGDDVEAVRVMAARAVARCRRRDAVPYLAAALRDEWAVAAQSARGLRDLGPAGRRELERVSERPAADLARQMIWELDRRTGAARA
jgi:HEAT repeat protein